jgi:hypothetical protein
LRWLTALRVSENQDEEDRAANEWLAGNNADVNLDSIGLHGRDFGCSGGGGQGGKTMKL